MTHDVLRRRLMRSIEALPEAQVYQVLDYIEFLESKHGSEDTPSASRLQQIAEGIEDRLRRRSVNPGTIREAFQVISAADRVISSVSAAGKRVLRDLGQVVEESGETGGRRGAGKERGDVREDADDDGRRNEHRGGGKTPSSEPRPEGQKRGQSAERPDSDGGDL